MFMAPKWNDSQQSNTILSCRVFGLQAVTPGFHSIAIKSHISPVICETPRSGILTIMNQPLVYYFHLPYLKDLLLQERKYDAAACGIRRHNSWGRTVL